MKLWGGRFETGPAALFERYSGSLHFDKNLFEADVIGSKAFANALARVGILTANERDRINAAFDEMLLEEESPGFFDAEDEDIHTFVIRKLGESVGHLSEKIHTGRSRNEQVAADFRLWMKGTIRSVQARLEALMGSLLQLAEREFGALLPGYTHLRRAQAVLFSHYLLAYFEMFHRDWERLQQAYERTDVSPYGCGALAGSGFPFDRGLMAADLGFSGVAANSLDAVSDRDFLLDFLYAASVAMLHASRMAEDWILYSSEEFGFLEMGDEVTSGSSLMPQKRNPDALELLRGKTGRVCGSLQALMMTLKGLPMSYNRDLQEDKEGVFDAAQQMSDSLDVLALCVDTARVRPTAMERAAEEGWVSATALAEILARNGVSFHRAHQIVGGIVLASVKQGKKPAEWTLQELRRFAPELDERARDALVPRNALENHRLPGGTASDSVREGLAAAKSRLARLEQASSEQAE
jgi:argininosuccinate lyase